MNHKYAFKSLCQSIQIHRLIMVLEESITPCTFRIVTVKVMVNYKNNNSLLIPYVHTSPYHMTDYPSPVNSQFHVIKITTFYSEAAKSFFMYSSLGWEGQTSLNKTDSMHLHRYYMRYLSR